MHHDSFFRAELKASASGQEPVPNQELTPGQTLTPESASAPGPARILTVRAQSGLSGDMLLAGLAALADLDAAALEALVEELRLPVMRGCLRLEERSVRHVAGVGCAINLPHEHSHRTFADIRTLIENSALPERAARTALSAFGLLAGAEAAVHGAAVSDVTFHEVGALDSILDICLSCRIFAMLAPARFVCSPLPLADGAIHCAHGLLPAPAPAVLRLLTGVPVRAFAGQGETVTPTAICLLKALGADFGPWPEMLVERTLISYGSKVFADAPNGALWAMGAAAGAVGVVDP
ncbi:LarC family nickel insertion protein [Desulfovibrio sp. OttesenSCG-928-G11]|nr:LarC family nickel insertion protein [Desulfovibrio sp. OttesenSCG-928-G11]